MLKGSCVKCGKQIKPKDSSSDEIRVMCNHSLIAKTPKWMEFVVRTINLISFDSKRHKPNPVLESEHLD